MSGVIAVHSGEVPALLQGGLCCALELGDDPSGQRRPGANAIGIRYLLPVDPYTMNS